MPPPEAGEEKTVRMRVTAKGHDRIHTGESDAQNLRALKFADGEEFDCPAESVASYEERGMARRVTVFRDALRAAGATRTLPQPPAPAPVAIDRDAIARLHARAERDATSGCLVWQGSKAKGGYGQITYRRMLMRTHRLAWVAERGPVPDGHYVCHACDNPACVAIEHLFLGTPKENYRDMRAKGRSRFNAKLSADEVSEIRRRAAAGETVVAIAKDFAVRYDQVLAIKNGRAWR